MANIIFVSKQTVVTAQWLQDVNTLVNGGWTIPGALGVQAALTAGSITTPTVASVGDFALNSGGAVGITSTAGLTLTATGGVTYNGTSHTMNNNLSVPSVTGVGSVNGGPLSGLRNRIINGDMRIDQRNGGAAQTIPSAGAYTVDRFIVACSGVASITGQRVAGVLSSYKYRLTGQAGVTEANINQRIESQNCLDLAGKTVTLAVDLANSLLTTVTWIAYYPNAVDNFSGPITQIATGTFTVSPTDTRYSTQIALPVQAVNGLQISLNVGAQVSGTFDTGRVSLVLGTEPTAAQFESRPLGLELLLCQRYFYSTVTTNLTGFLLSTNQGTTGHPHPSPMRSGPSLSIVSNFSVLQTSGGGATSYTIAADNATTTQAGYLISSITPAGTSAGGFRAVGGVFNWSAEL